MQETLTDVRSANIPGCPGYTINELGEVKSPHEKGGVTPYFENDSSRWVVEIKTSSNRKRFLLHNLLANLFLPNPLECRYTLFKDGNPRNYRLDNLEWKVRGMQSGPMRIGQPKKERVVSVMTSEDVRKAERFYAKDKLKTRRLFNRYSMNSVETMLEVCRQFDTTGSVDDSICEVINESSPEFAALLKDMMLYYRIKMTAFRVITDEVLLDMERQYGETIGILKQFRVNKKKTNKLSVRSRMITAAKIRAEEKRVPFNLCAEDVLLPRVCPYLKTELIYNATRASNQSPSLDRIIPSMGYVPGNIQVISLLANQMKSNATAEQILMFSQNAPGIHS